MRIQLQRVPTVGIVSLSLLALVATSLNQSTVHASAAKADPLVVVVRDATAGSNCLFKLVENSGTTHQTTRIVACPAGTVMRVIHVPESEALRNHESYVVLPATSSTLAEQSHVAQQIEELENAANAHYRNLQVSGVRSAASLQPLTTSCGSSGNWATAWYSNWWDSGDVFDAEVIYDHHTDCSIYIDQSRTAASQINTPWYRGKDAYAGSTWYWPCTFQGTNLLIWYPKVTKSAGYYYEQYEYSGSHCTIFDNSGYTTLMLN